MTLLLLKSGEMLQRPFSDPVLVFAFILLIILLAPILLKRLHIPGIIGLILSGVLFGPHGLNILEKNAAIDLFATIGLLYIMFLAGLDLDIADFRKNRSRSIFFGAFTFFFPILIGFPVCHYFLGFDMHASLLTSSMFATHTLVAYPIVSKFGLSRNRAVAVTVGGTIITDSAVLIILAVILGSSKGNLTANFWLQLLVSLAVFIVFMIYLVPVIVKRFFRKLSAEKHSQYILVLAVVFIAALLAEFAGLEPIIGAFLAGLALNPLIPHSSALMNRIEFLGNSLFIPFFLISVGMLVDLKIILMGPTAILVAAVLTIVALLGKWLAAIATQLIGGYTRAQRKLIFGLSSSHAAATLAVILVGYEAGLLDENILNGTIILILVTCLVAFFVTDRASREIVMKTVPDVKESEAILPGMNEHILLPVANPGNLENLLDLAHILRNPKSANPVSLLSVVPNNEKAEENILTARKQIEHLFKHASASDMRINFLSCIDHNAVSGIARTSREILASLIIIGWPERPALIELLTGDKADSMANNTDKCLFICSLPKNPDQFKRILLHCPAYSELETGFMEWLEKVFSLANELNIPLQAYGSRWAMDAVKAYGKRAFPGITVSVETRNDSDNKLFPPELVRKDDLLIVVTARRSSISYHPRFEFLPVRLSQEFKDHGRILIYPGVNVRSLLYQGYEDLSPEPLRFGLSWLSGLLKRKKN